MLRIRIFKNIFLCFLLSVILTSGGNIVAEPLHKNTKALYAAIDEATAKIHKKFGLERIGEGGASNKEGKIIKVNLSLQSRKKLTMDEGRKLMFECADTLLQTVNSNKQIQPHLPSYALGIQNLDITIDIIEEDGDRPNYPDFLLIGLLSGEIRFMFGDPVDSFQSTYVRETVEEARRKVAESGGKK